MKTVVIVQARMTSTRLPGKVLMQVLGKSLLEYLVERLRRVKLADAFLIATTGNATDDPVVALCQRLEVACTRGPEHDVLARYHAAASAHGAGVVVRVTADCPLIDPAVIDAAIALYRSGAYDYVSNALNTGYPVGMAAEVFSFALLEQARREASAPAEREHVTPFFYGRPERYRIGRMVNQPDLGHERWTVDTEQDFELVRRMIEATAPHCAEVEMNQWVDLLDQHPGWRAINQHVKQKTLDE